MRTSTRIDNPSRIFAAQQRGVACFSLALSLAFAFAPPPARAQDKALSGKDIVDTVCAECHATGVDGAPKIGSTEAWSNRASQGLSSLTVHALEGIRKMPAHGGRSNLSDLEIARAVTYMVNQSGGSWVEPASVQDLTAERSAELIVKTQCIKCHGEGVGGAPKIGDLQAWVPRMKQGLGHAVRSAIRGHGGMPPRGGQANLTDAELRSAILYMYNPAGAPARPSASAATPDPSAGTESNHLSMDGVSIYLGFMPAQKLRALPEGSPERTMHGGIPTGSGYYHVNVSLFDEERRAPISDAKVQMHFEQPGLTSAETALEPMTIGAGSYGNYINPLPRTPYLITLSIDRPGANATIEAKFKQRFD